MIKAAEIDNYLQVDREGNFSAQGVLIKDDEAGQELFENMHYLKESFQIVSHMQDHYAFIEYFDTPLIAQSLIKPESGSLCEITFNYNYKLECDLKTLTVDRWDRFHAITPKGIPFVFSAKAQNLLFELSDRFDDDCIVLNDVTLNTPDYMSTSSDCNEHSFWNDRYVSKDTPWDMAEPTPIINEILPQLKLNKCRILVLGCGSGSDAARLAESGHIVTGLDFSESAVKKAQNEYSHIKNLSFQQQDAFNLPKAFLGQFDVVFEHTLFCAIDPQKREALIKAWRSCLTAEGHLLSIFFVMDKPVGPPFGASEWELESLLKNKFKPLFWTRWKGSWPGRKGTELVYYGQKITNGSTSY